MKNLRMFFALCACLCLLLPLCRQAQADPITGVYRITAKVQPGMCLDVASFGNINGTSVVQWYSSHTSNQQWLVERQSDGSYKIYAYSGQNSLQMLDDNGNGVVTDGNPVTTWEDLDNVGQRWYFVDMGNGFYRIVPKNAGYPNPVTASTPTLDIRNGNNAKQGDALNIYHYLGTNNQLFHLDWAGPAKLWSSGKKGIGGRENKTPPLNCSWYYTWGGDLPGDAPTGVEFVPMEWGYYGNNNNDNVNWLNWVKSQPGVGTILAFNEPDGAGQANLTVAQALDGYQYLNNLGLPIGSPAAVHADDQWMRDFMSGAAQKGYRVDYVTIHWYGGNDPGGFLNYVDYIHNLYGKPVWITEFCPADWSGNHGISAGDCAWFMRQVIPALNSRWYVQRYAWYTGDTPQSNGTLSTAGLVNDDGTLSDLGKLYARL